ncbi:hypothetical protein L8Y18_08390, partial [Campylobacter sp. CNRCH_2007_0968H]|nr:hypothetical protein [Campylobacter sp. CNRCH_2007_0968H]
LMQGYLNTQDKTFNQVTALDKDKKANIHLVGNEVHADIATFKDIGKLAITAKDKGSLYLNASGYYYNPTSFKNFNYERKSYNNAQDQHGKPIIIHHNENNFINVKYVGIGSDVDWWHFAKGWNENEDFRNIASEYRLTNDIDFKGNQGKGKEGKDWQNYANYCIDGYGCTNMIVGFNGDSAFTKTFDGQGYTLKNINIDTTGFVNNKSDIYVGIFGIADGAKFKNINVDYMGGGIQNKDVYYIGGFVGYIDNGNFSQISLKNIKNFNSDNGYIYYAGGFAGYINNGNFSNISLSEIGNFYNNSLRYNYTGGFAGYITVGTFKNIDLNAIENLNNKISRGYYDTYNYTGGFAGMIRNGNFSNISLSEIGKFYNIRNDNAIVTSFVGGFAGSIGNGNFSNISLNNIENIGTGGNVHSYAGGFAGSIGNGNFSNISLNNIENIGTGESTFLTDAGGFAGKIYKGNFSNIVLNGISNIIGNFGHNTDAGGFVGSITGNDLKFNNIFLYFNSGAEIGSKRAAGKFAGYINNIKVDGIHIYHHENDLTNATADQDYWNDFNNGYISDKINIHTYKDETQGYSDFEKAVIDSLAKEGLHKDKNGKLIFTTDFEIEKPTNPTDPTDPSNPDVILDSDDLYVDVVEDILDDILDGDYTVSIDDLGNIIFKESSPDGDRVITLKSIYESLEFLEELYKQKGMQDKLKDIYAKYTKALELNNFLLSIVQNDIDKAKENINKFNFLLKEYNTVLSIYNDYVEKINKGQMSITDDKFVTALAKLNSYAKDLISYKEYVDGVIVKLNNKYDIEKNYGYTNFKFTDIFASLNFSHNLQNPDVDNPNKPELPETDMEFEQTASLNLIGDNALDDDDEKKEIDETSLAQKNKTCIVSDNYKTMNPCIVSGM